MGLSFITLILIALKLAGITFVSWWVVFAPMLIELSIFLILLLIGGIMTAWNETRGEKKNGAQKV